MAGVAASAAGSAAITAVADIPTWAAASGSDVPISGRVALWRGNMALLAADAVVNAANTGLRRGGGICGALHRAAGPELEVECAKIGSCATGSAVITRGYKLPAKHVIHAVGPVGEQPEALAAAYKSSLDVAHAAALTSIGFCSISTGIYGYPPAKAAPVAVAAVREWLEAHPESPIVVVFVVFSATDHDLYEATLRVALK